MEAGILFIRVKRLCEESRISIAFLEKELGFGNGTIVRWKTASPTIDKIMDVAQYFHVTVDYLCGLSDSRQSAEGVLSDEDIVSFQRATSRMTPADKTRAMRILKIGFEYAFRGEEDGENT